MQDPTYTIKRFKSWNQFKDFANQFSENWLFRGQSDSAWDLKSSFERTDFFKKYDGIESSFLIDFQRGAKNFLTERETPTDLIEWLALMQHHGAPTRLLDFTKSVYIASYFAFENVDPKTENVAVWAINIKVIHDRVVQHLKLSQLTDKDFETIFYSNDESCILPVESFQMNRRYSLQQSIFVSPGNSHESFMEQLQFLDEDITKVVLKITLPSKLKNEVLRDLQKMNINRASIFPDIDGYSVALKMKYNSMRTMEEYIKQQSELIKGKKFTFYP
ncbi:MAG: FRG domain-containing protein [Candidatus Azobacteroides sp.]|nr:FRG domain-containing protein [Candidatus Azobacteroides sp.]